MLPLFSSLMLSSWYTSSSFTLANFSSSEILSFYMTLLDFAGLSLTVICFAG
jgi:hypothetical protein